MELPRGLAVAHHLGSHAKFVLQNIPRIQPRIASSPSTLLGHNVLNATKPAKHRPLIPTAAARRDDNDNNNPPAAAPLSILDSFSGTALTVFFSTLVSTLALSPAALALEDVAYNPQDGAETLKTVAGVAYIGLVIFYFIRLFQKRADKFTSERVGSSVDDINGKAEEDDEEKDALELEAAAAAQLAEDNVTPLQCLIGVAQAGTICYLLFLLSTSVDAYFDKQELPTQYTARNITVLIQTVSRGLVYLATFIFGANAVGLTSLGIALIVAPDWVNNGPQSKKKQENKLPKVNITDDIYTLRRAFKEAEEMGRRNAENEK